MTIKHLFPEALPTLNLDFANSKALDPRITFSRSSTGTYADAEGIIQTAADDEPRFDHDPATGESLGLLIEESRTNLIADSVDGATAATGNNTIKVSNFETVANISLNKFEVNTGQTAASANLNPITAASSGFNTASLFIKFSPGLDRQCRINLSNFGFSKYIELETSTLQVSGTDLDPEYYSVKRIKDGLVRVSLTIDLTSDLSGLLSVTSSGTWTPGEYFCIGAYQLEAGSFPTSYIPTSGSTAIRAADIASITGTNFSSWYNQNQGTVLSTFKSPVPESNARYWLLISDGANSLTSAYRFEMERITAATSSGSNAWSSTGDWLIPTGYTQNAENRTAFVYDRINNFNSFSNNGAILATNNSATDVTVAPTTLTIGAAGANKKFSGHIYRFAYYPIRLPDEQLEALTA
jgi:hypothetical protein